MFKQTYREQFTAESPRFFRMLRLAGAINTVPGAMQLSTIN
jgi:hypothetical protein